MLRTVLENCIHKRHTANFTSDEYREVWNNYKILTHQMKQIVSIDHVLFTKNVNKQSLSSFYDKGYYLSPEDRYLAPGFLDISKKKKALIYNNHISRYY